MEIQASVFKLRGTYRVCIEVQGVKCYITDVGYPSENDARRVANQAEVLAMKVADEYNYSEDADIYVIGALRDLSTIEMRSPGKNFTDYHYRQSFTFVRVLTWYNKANNTRLI